MLKSNKTEGLLEVTFNYDRILLIPMEEGIELLKLIQKGTWLARTWASSSSSQFKEIDPEITITLKKENYLEVLKTTNMIAEESNG